MKAFEISDLYTMVDLQQASSQTPYSRSTQRRRKRKEKAALTADLGEVGAVLDQVLSDEPGLTKDTPTAGEDNRLIKPKGKLTAKKRQKIL